MRGFTIVFFAINFLLCVLYIDSGQNANTTSRALPIVTLYESGTLQIDAYHELTIDKSYVDGHYYSDKAPLPTFITIPFFGLAHAVGIVQPQDGSLFGRGVYHVGDVVCGVIPFVLFILLVFKTIPKTAQVSPVLMSMLPLYGCFIFVYAGAFFAHILAGLLLVLSYRQLQQKNFWWAGTWVSLAFTADFSMALAFPIWAILIYLNEKQWKPSLYFLLGLLPGVGAILLYNYWHTGSPFHLMYKYVAQAFASEEVQASYGFTYPKPSAIWGLLFSQYKGLFIYMPVLLFVAWYFLARLRKQLALFKHYVLALFVAMVLLFASHALWWGGWTWGPRHLIPMGMLLAYAGIKHIAMRPPHKALLWAIIGAGVLLTFLAKFSLRYSVPSHIEWPVPYLLPKFFNGQHNPYNLLTQQLNTSPTTSMVVWLLLFISSVIFLSLWYKRKTACDPTSQA